MSNLRMQHPGISIEHLCSLFGKKRQSYYEKISVMEANVGVEAHVVALVLEQRKKLDSLGGRKLLHLLSQDPQWAKLDVGRDRFFNILRSHGLLIRKRKSRKVRTTDSNHWLKKYPNLLKDILIIRSEQAWVSDITYIRVRQRFSYLFLITDVYSSRIMGYHLSEDMSVKSGILALKMALDARMYPGLPLLHHSDRGSQYCSFQYTSLLKSKGIAISMTEDSNPGENAKAERVNGILKGELKLGNGYTSHQQACKSVERAIKAYNQLRPHLSCGYLTPDQAHQKNKDITRNWKDYSKKNSKSNKHRQQNEFFKA